MCPIANAFAADSEATRLQESATVVKELRAAPDSGIPEQLWDDAACVAVIPSVKKAAFVVGGEYGKGVMSCREANGWSAPVFLELAKGSWGAQIGAQQIDLVLLVMNKTGAQKLLQDKVSLGGDASVAAGPVGRSAHAATDAQLKAEILSYSRSQGVFAGVDLSGGVLRPDEDANKDLYGASVKPQDVLFGHHAVPAAARGFVQTLSQPIAKATTGVKER
jgi:lipid-binding SYLF domain-containing protein